MKKGKRGAFPSDLGRLPALQRGAAGGSRGMSGAEDEIRTRDPNLGKVVLYQLSYFRLKAQ